ncbi:MAG: hypothetical protein A3C53_05030 [Omnitrophica WOR_2 bacterium RIFCSPHIGHO2_02_FULL_68_15]|nr:MAG: hypothetical protein A3C53_05030 [Omnitrophica WOR_2 bacterium RIFCSPHIGHO2_02_FULL_68_15]
MKITVSTTPLERQSVQVLALPIAEQATLPSWGARWPAAVREAVSRLLKEKDATGKLNEVVAIPAPAGLKARWLLIVGLGQLNDLAPDRLRQAAAVAARRAQSQKRSSLAFPVIVGQGITADAAGQALAEGLRLGTYRYLAFKTLKPEERVALAQVSLVVERGVSSAAVTTGVSRGTTIAEAACFARDLINRPSNLKYPQTIAADVRAMARRAKIACRVYQQAELVKMGMDCIVAVGQGSAHPPVFVTLEYVGPGAKGQKPLVFVGKGITFDSGGISIKPSDKMDLMKYDMSGGAAVAGALQAIAALTLPVRVVGLIPFSENLPGGSAQRPGDIIRAYKGKTIEVLNTDAEGRLVLADALGYAQRYAPAAVIDLATLTGACVVALGHYPAGLLSTHAGLTQRLKEAAERTHERVWELPLWPEYTEHVRSEVADLKNVGDGSGGTITAAAFLKEFAGDAPWAHLDIAGVAWADKDQAYLVRGGTGFGVRLLTELAASWKPLPSTAKAKG